MNEFYGNLEKVINDTIQRTIETKTFNFDSFIQLMETEFTRLGFRDNPTGGG